MSQGYSGELTVLVLDIRETHKNNNDCPMRITPHPNGQDWYCVDCGIKILRKRLTADTESMALLHEEEGWGE
jgi:hypothetical protein